MFSLRCTEQVLKCLKVKPDLELPSSTTLLGDWYAKYLILDRQHFVVCCCDRTYLPVVVTARDLAKLPRRLTQSLGDVLAALSVPEDLIHDEQAAMREVVFGKTANRVATGVLVDYARMLDHPSTRMDDLIEISLGLAETPLFAGSPRVVFPNRATVRVFTEAAESRLLH